MAVGGATIGCEPTKFAFPCCDAGDESVAYNGEEARLKAPRTVALIAPQRSSGFLLFFLSDK